MLMLRKVYKSRSLMGRTSEPREIPRCVPDEQFPPYSYVTGRFPHPTSDPAGHSFGCTPEQPATPDPSRWDACRAYLYGIDLFNTATIGRRTKFGKVSGMPAAGLGQPTTSLRASSLGRRQRQGEGAKTARRSAACQSGQRTVAADGVRSRSGSSSIHGAGAQRAHRLRDRLT